MLLGDDGHVVEIDESRFKRLCNSFKFKKKKKKIIKINIYSKGMAMLEEY